MTFLDRDTITEPRATLMAETAFDDCYGIDDDAGDDLEYPDFD